MAATRVLILSEVRLYREGLAAMFGGQGDITIVGTSDGSAQSIEESRHCAADVLVIDSSSTSALESLGGCRAVWPAIKPVVLAIDGHHPNLIGYADAEASAYVAADASLQDVVAAIHGVMRGEVVCSPRIVTSLLRRLAASSLPTAAAPIRALSRRERQVLGLLHEGLSNKEIAQRFSISEATVKNHVHHLLEKLNVPTRALAVVTSSPAGGARAPAWGRFDAPTAV